MTPAASTAQAAGAGWRRLANRLGIDLRPGEAAPAALLFLCFFLFITFQYATRSVRQSAYISDLGAANLPWVYLALALCSYPFLRIYSRFADRMARHHLIAATCFVTALSMVGFWWLFQFSLRWIPVVLYVWISIIYVMTVSQFWSFSNHVFDPRQAKRLFGFIGAGGLLGGIAGGQMARVVSAVADTRSTFLVAAVVLLSAVGVIYLVHRLRPGDLEFGAGATVLAKLEKTTGGFALIQGSRHLQLIAAVLILTVMVARVVDLQFNWAVEQATTTLEERTRFYGNFYSIMGISAFLFQLLFTSRIHRVLGVGFAMRILPVTMAIGTGVLFGAAAILPAALLMAASVLKVGESGLRYSLDQATRELLFLPVPSKVRVKAKAFIDVFVQPSAKGLAALLLLSVTFGLLTAVQTGWISLALIACWLAVTVWAYREYVRSFRRGLKQRTVDTELPINLSDVRTLELLVQSLGSSDRRQVLHSLELLASNGRGNLVPPLLLYHDDPEVRLKTLEVLAQEGRRDAAPLVERRLADQDPNVRAEAVRVLGRFHGKNICELMYPRLREAEPSIRAAAVACLANHGDEEMTREATEVLSDLLSDADPEVRKEAAKAIGAIHEPQYQEHLVQLLYDRDSGVTRETIGAVRRRVARDGYNPLYVPTLISLQQKRRVKHEAREALVALGEPVIPALVHFMNDPDETKWVRRALPKTIARIVTPAAAQALTDSLGQPEDSFLRRKLIEALAGLPSDLRESVDSERVGEEVRREAQRYLQTLAGLFSIGMTQKGRLAGPVVVWESETLEPDLVDRLLGERLEEQLNNLFGLLAVVHPPRHIWASHRSLLSRQAALRNHALEYLDNTLTGEMRRDVFAVIDDSELSEKLRLAKKLFGISTASRIETLREFLTAPAGSDGDAMNMTLAALYAVYTDRLTDLYPLVEEVRGSTADPLITETATWVTQRLGL